MASETELNDDLKTAMKAREMETVYVLRGLLTAIRMFKDEKRVTAVTDADISTLVRREINKRNEAAEFARKAAREEAEQASLRERTILEKYLPQQLDAAALEQTIRALSSELATTQMGPIMAKLKERFPGQYDGKLASEIAKKLT